MNDADMFRPIAPWNNLRLRAELLARLRAHFDALGFLEVDTPLLSRDTVVDRHLDPLAVDVAGTGQMFLQTSPEFGMKRLLASGDDGPQAIYQVCKAFRAGERGPLHNVEFTMVEWYRAGDDYVAGMELLDSVQEVLLGQGSAERLSYRQAFMKHADFDPLTIETELLPSIAAANGIAAPPTLDDDRDGWLDLFLVEKVMPKLGVERPVILYDYPASQAALAIVRDEQPPVAERFELFYFGVELANGYHELLDPEVLRTRNEEANRQRIADGKQPLPVESRLLEAMRHGLPACAGCALGFDRTVMLAAGAEDLSEVIPFPQERA